MGKKEPRRWAATKGEKMAQGLAQAIEVGDCLEWQGFFGCNGVTPIVKARNTEKDRTDNYSVPRELWEAAYGEIPSGNLVYRSCCNNACILLDHIKIGTRKEWSAAQIRSGKTKRDLATKTKLTIAARNRASTVNTMEKARDVRSMRAAGMRREDIAASTGVSFALVSDILQGRRWKETSSPFAGLGGANEHARQNPLGAVGKEHDGL